MDVKRSARWLVPGAVAAVIAVGAVAPGASADLPAKTPQEVLVMAAEADVPTFSGTVVARTDLGLPTALLGGLDADGGMPSGAPGETERTARLWKDGDSLARASVETPMGEQTVIVSGDEVWFYDSETAVVTTGTLPEAPEDAAEPWDGRPVPDPAEAAQWLLDALEPTTQVSAGEPTTVAGRAAYEVVLTPTQEGTLVGSASMAVDAQTGAVLRVQVTAVGAGDPSIDVGFSAFDPDSEIAASVFSTDVPPGATVERYERGDTPTPSAGPGAPAPESAGTVVGTGWTTVVLTAPGTADLAEADLAGADPESAALLDSVLVPYGDDGARVVTSDLVSVMVTADGRVLAGMVTPEVLAAAAAG